MLTIVCETPGLLKAEQRAKPVRAEGEVLVRIRRVGICGTDLHIFSGNQPYLAYPRVMGHELAGVIEEVPNGSALQVGDIACIVPYLSCGQCVACRHGKTNCCTSLQVLGVHRDGGLTEYLSLPERFVLPVPGLSLDEAAMVEFLAIGAHAVRRSRLSGGERILIVGGGPIGMAVALFAGLNGGVVTVLDARADRLAFCASHLGVASVVQTGADDTAQLFRLTEGDMYDVVFDATGSPAAMERGFGFVAHGGTYVLVSIVSSQISFSDPEFHKRETTLLGSRNATREDFETVVTALRAGQIPTKSLNTHRLSLDQLPLEFAKLIGPDGGVVKALVEID